MTDQQANHYKSNQYQNCAVAQPNCIIAGNILKIIGNTEAISRIWAILATQPEVFSAKAGAKYLIAIPSNSGANNGGYYSN